MGLVLDDLTVSKQCFMFVSTVEICICYVKSTTESVTKGGEKMIEIIEIYK